MKNIFFFLGALLPTTILFADGERAVDHAPIGVMGDHFHKKGESMISLRHIKMYMAGNLIGNKDVSDGQIIELPNPYQMGNMPPKLSVVPQNMEMDMTMLGMMYAPSDSITIMGMGMFMGKEMKLNTYKGMMDRALLGTFNSSSFDLSDFSVSALIKLKKTENSRWHTQLGIQKSVGKENASGEVLTPMNATQSIILPYGMQSGDKSTALISALTYVTTRENWVFGGQLRMKSNISEDKWHFGNSLSPTGWLQRELSSKTSVSLRLTYRHQYPINGRNNVIMAPVQTANPNNYGGKTIELGTGLNQLFKIFPGDHADRFGIEVSYPIYQNLNGPQMKSGLSIQLGYQKSF